MSGPDALPRHIAIIMDGNGRWAQQRKKPRTMGHQAGLRALRKVVAHCVRKGVESLTVFAFSSENWNRPQVEVSRLMDLFMRALDKEVAELHENGVHVRFIGERGAFAREIRSKMERAEQLTGGNRRMNLNVAANYGGRWDITQAARRLVQGAAEGRVRPADVDEELFASGLATAGAPDPDLFIRTGGEMRISNFLLWQSAYSELYFSPVLWPDFDEVELDKALAAFAERERRFGLTGEQARTARNA